MRVAPGALGAAVNTVFWGVDSEYPPGTSNNAGSSGPVTSAVTRMLDLGAPHYLIQSTLAGVVAQRLVRTLCPHCKVEAAQDETAWRVLTHGWDLPVPERVFAPKGCLECRNTGFLGRTGIYEMMLISARLREMISPQLDLGGFSAVALAEGMQPLRISAAAQVARGITTVAEVLNVLPASE